MLWIQIIDVLIWFHHSWYGDSTEAFRYCIHLFMNTFFTINSHHFVWWYARFWVAKASSIAISPSQTDWPHQWYLYLFHSQFTIFLWCFDCYWQSSPESSYYTVARQMSCIELSLSGVCPALVVSSMTLWEIITDMSESPTFISIWAVFGFSCPYLSKLPLFLHATVYTFKPFPSLHFWSV